MKRAQFQATLSITLALIGSLLQEAFPGILTTEEIDLSAKWSWTGVTFPSQINRTCSAIATRNAGNGAMNAYVVTENGYLLTSENGKFWYYRKVTNDKINDIALDGFNHSTIIIAKNSTYDGGGLWELTDDGARYTKATARDRSNNSYTVGWTDCVAQGNGVMAMGTFSDTFAWKDIFSGPSSYKHTGSSRWDKVPGNPGNIVDIVYQPRNGGSRTKNYWWIASFSGDDNDFSVRRSELWPDINFSRYIRFQNRGANAEALAISPDGERLVAVGGNRIVATDDGGESWKSLPPLLDANGASADLTTVRWANHRFLAAGRHGNIFSSFDGLTWYHRGKTRAGTNIHDIGYANGNYIAVGYDQTQSRAYIAYSDGSAISPPGGSSNPGSSDPGAQSTTPGEASPSALNLYNASSASRAIAKLRKAIRKAKKKGKNRKARSLKRRLRLMGA